MLHDMMEIRGEEEYLCRASADQRLPQGGEPWGRIPRQSGCQNTGSGHSRRRRWGYHSLTTAWAIETGCRQSL